jgi:3'-phosphoadenosine 5'-phosphosulfate sulfotransferase (PAPS reductase)/FAD synthetase
MKMFEQLPANIIDTKTPNTRYITFVRHLESKYNEYKILVKSNPDYQEFMNTNEKIGENNDIKIKLARKNELAHVLLKDFFQEVGIDYET